MSTGAPSATAKAQADVDANTPSFSSIGVKNTTINEGAGVQLSSHQKLLVGSVLDVRFILFFSAFGVSILGSILEPSLKSTADT